MRSRLPASLLLLLLCGCAQTWESHPPSAPPGGTGLTQQGEVVEGADAVSSITKAPARNATGTVEPFGTQGKAAAYEYSQGYRIGAGDRLTIRVAGEADLTGDYTVDASGMISMPYIQTFSVAGSTTAQIEDNITARLKRGYLRSPQVSVQLAASRPFYILGEVGNAGSYVYQPGITVQNAIAIAGGYSARADQGSVLLTRKNDSGTGTYKAPVTTQIYPGDIIYVRERWF